MIVWSRRLYLLGDAVQQPLASSLSVKSTHIKLRANFAAFLAVNSAEASLSGVDLKVQALCVISLGFPSQHPNM